VSDGREGPVPEAVEHRRDREREEASNLKATLRPYQESGLSWLKFLHEHRLGRRPRRRHGARQDGADHRPLCSRSSRRRRRLRTLIVAPTSVVTNWERELARFAPTLSVALWHGADRKDQADELRDAEVVITSYALLRRDEEFLRRSTSRTPSSTRPSTSRTRCRRPRPPRSAQGPASPRPHGHADREPPLRDLEHLRLRLAWAARPARQVRVSASRARSSRATTRPRSGCARRSTRSSCAARRTRSPRTSPRRSRPIRSATSRASRRSSTKRSLREVRAQVMGEVERVGVAKSQLQILAGLTRLRQAACDPRLLGLPKEFSDEDSGKLVALRELLSNAVEGGHKVLVFSQFVTMLRLIEKAVKEDGIRYEYLDGSTKDRAERVERFQRRPERPVCSSSASRQAGRASTSRPPTRSSTSTRGGTLPSSSRRRIGPTASVRARSSRSTGSSPPGTIEEKILAAQAEEARARRERCSPRTRAARRSSPSSDLEDLFSIE
jgi:hypothetical protein